MGTARLEPLLRMRDAIHPVRDPESSQTSFATKIVRPRFRPQQRSFEIPLLPSLILEDSFFGTIQSDRRFFREWIRCRLNHPLTLPKIDVTAPIPLTHVAN